MAAARAARYRLLAAAAGQVGTDLVLAGHTLDDQAETLWMRSRRGGDPAAPGLAGIAPATLHDGAVWFARPLLDVRREALRDWLRAAGVSWTDDPSNEAPRFERVRARQAVRAMDEAAFAALIEAGARARSARAALGREAALTMDAAATMPLPGLVRIGRDRLQRLDDDVRICLLRILLAVCGGCGHLPAAGDVASAWRSLPERRRVSLSRCLLDARRDAVFIHREGRGLPGPAELTHGDVWDGRYRLLAPDAQGAVRVEPAGDWSSPSDASTGVPPALARAAMRRLPVAAERVIFEPVPGPWAKLLPSFDLAAAAATARLFGAKPPPAPPFAGHIGQTAFDACLTETQGHAWQG